MNNFSSAEFADDYSEIYEWLEAFNSVIKYAGAERAEVLLQHMKALLQEKSGVINVSNTAYCNTIQANKQADYPDGGDVAKKASALIKWNALAMVAKAAVEHDGLGGHISTYASSAVLYDVGFNEFFKGRNASHLEDCIFVQGHASPGIYARALLEGRLSQEQIEHFRRECDQKGVSSYPHPWLMPDFWQFPTVSMGLGPLNAVYHARFTKYLINRGFISDTQRKFWAFCGDGEMDEPETLSALSFASYEGLNNLVFVVNCNLQRLDGLVRSQGSIVQELEARFSASGWRVIKVLFNSAWDKLFAKDKSGAITQAFAKLVDGQLQRFSYGGAKVWREEFFNTSPELKSLIAGMTDADLEKLSWGGHDAKKVYAAFHEAVNQQKVPTVILAQTTKGRGIPGSEGVNAAHNVKKLSLQALEEYAEINQLPINAESARKCTLIAPIDNDPAIQYLKDKRQSLGGSLPKRYTDHAKLSTPAVDFFASVLEGSGDRKVSSTMTFVRSLTLLLKHKELGKHIVPIVADESRTFGMEGLFRQIGIYNRHGQSYTPVDRDQVMYYREATDGQLLQEGINEAGATSSWLAAATSYSHSGVAMVPFYIFYSMFGFQRVADLIWAAADSRARGFLIGATSGRTTLAGEGLQHTDGHSHVMAATVPNCKSYDPTYGYELAVIIQHGLKRMLQEEKDEFYYLTVVNENILHRKMPENVTEGIVKGMYLLESFGEGPCQVNLLSCGAILPEALKAAQELHESHGVVVNLWSATSFNELARDGASCARLAYLEPERNDMPIPYITSCLSEHQAPVIAVTDYIRAYAEQVRPYIDSDYLVLGTDGFGRSDTRENMRKFFEVDSKMIIYAAFVQLYKAKTINVDKLLEIRKQYNIDINKANPMHV